MRRITAAQAQALQAQLVAAGYDVPVYVAMRYWHPLIESVVQQIKLDATLDAFVQALNWVNQNTPEKILNALKLQSLGYRDIRARFGLSSNLAQQVCRRVVSARKTASQKKPSGQSLQGGLRDLRCPHLLLPSERLDSIAHHR